MSWTIPLPARTAQLAKGNTHPGLLLDKYAASWNERPGNEKFSEKVQRPTVDRVADLSRSAPLEFYADLLKRHRQSRPSGTVFQTTTIGPLTLHLSRPSALENAGICLHPIYGFAYLPGSGLKGMAHAYACEVWLPARTHREAAWKTICEIFGTAPSPWLRDLAKRLQVASPNDTRAGAIVFHDAWATTWPQLIVDIVNSHHPAYYAAGENDNEHPPGDWENPVPVNFLAVPDGVQFEFAVSPRCRAVLTATQTACAPSGVDAHPAPDPLGSTLNDEGTAPSPGDDEPLVQLATQWLAGALAHLGAGAKTAAGYGTFRIDSAPPTQPTLVADVQTTWDTAQKSKSCAEFSCTLELITPAFLAGAKQAAEDCDLRPATLRGQLRWWWRTLHAGHVDVATLRRMEAAIWGDTKQGGAVRVIVEPVAVEVVTLWKNPWFVLDQIGAALQSFAQANASTGHGKHCESKLALGLPRQIHGPRDFKLPHQKSHTPPKQLVGPKGDRHASPVHFHVGRKDDGRLVVRVVAFPAPHLPSFKESEQLLEQLLKHSFAELHERISKYKTRGQKWPVAASGLAGPKADATASESKSRLPKPGDMVQAVLLEERTKKGGWRAKHAATEIAGPIQNSPDVPADKKAGDTLTLRVQSANEREIAFRYPTAADQTTTKKAARTKHRR